MHISCRDHLYISFLFRQDILEKSNKQHLAAEAKKRQELKKQLKVIKYLTKIILKNEETKVIEEFSFWQDIGCFFLEIDNIFSII
jgi:hypothetical protein